MRMLFVWQKLKLCTPVALALAFLAIIPVRSMGGHSNDGYWRSICFWISSDVGIDNIAHNSDRIAGTPIIWNRVGRAVDPIVKYLCWIPGSSLGDSQ